MIVLPCEEGFAPHPNIALAGAAAVTAPPLCRELSLYACGDLWTAWQGNVLAADLSADPPYWTIAWPGGQALARFLLDHPTAVAGRKVLDCGAGTGVAAIAAARAGARHVVAVDRDPRAIAAVRANAALNRVNDVIETRGADLVTLRLDAYDVIAAGDLWYERFAAAQITTQLRQAAGLGIDVLIGDNARAYAPRRGMTVLAEYAVPVDPRIESACSSRAYVAKLYGTPTLT
jgi:predicted nicotinamide N-methyase